MGSTRVMENTTKVKNQEKREEKDNKDFFVFCDLEVLL